jgi:hypothetical protein
MCLKLLRRFLVLVRRMPSGLGFGNQHLSDLHLLLHHSDLGVEKRLSHTPLRHRKLARCLMADPAPEGVGKTDIAVREPKPEEFARVAYLFRNTRLHSGSRFIAAERTQPVHRFLGAAAWWGEGDSGRFQLACLPGAAQGDAAADPVQRVLAVTREAGLKSAQYADLLPEGHVWLAVLQAQGFERLRCERSFEVAYEDAWTRVMRLYERHKAHVPANWKSASIREHPPEAIQDLIAPYRLLPAETVRHYWRDTTPGGFDLDMSCILFSDSSPFGAFLARRLSDVLYVDVQVVDEPNPRLRSLADVCQLYHSARLVAPGGPIRWIHLRSGEAEHRQTANLALRMGGRELPSQHVLGRRLEG